MSERGERLTTHPELIPKQTHFIDTYVLHEERSNMKTMSTTPGLKRTTKQKPSCRRNTFQFEAAMSSILTCCIDTVPNNNVKSSAKNQMRFCIHHQKTPKLMRRYRNESFSLQNDQSSCDNYIKYLLSICISNHVEVNQ